MKNDIFLILLSLKIKNFREKNLDHVIVCLF